MPFQHHSIFICTLKRNKEENKKAKWLNFERGFQMQSSCLFWNVRLERSQRERWLGERTSSYEEPEVQRKKDREKEREEYIHGR